MIETSILIALILLLGLLLTSRVLSRVALTLPILCLGLGYGLSKLGIFPEVMDSTLLILTEGTLAVVLFSDAASLRHISLKQGAEWPMRALGIGMPISVVLGAIVAFLFMPEMGLWTAVLLAAFFVPTDAALGQAVVTNCAIPSKTRHAILVESGLNDGLSLPFILFAACAVAGFNHDVAQDNWYWYASAQITFGLISGGLIGALGGWILLVCEKQNLVAKDHGAICALLLLGIAYFAAPLGGGNSFVAVFAAGFCFGRLAKTCSDYPREFLETDGLLLSMIAFMFIGGVLLTQGLGGVTWGILGIALVSLFIVRPVAIFISMLGSGATLKTKLLLGWFGPRGLATALFVVFILEEIPDLPHKDMFYSAAALIVLLSTILHGISSHFIPYLYTKDETP